MGRPSKFPTGVRERAVRLVLENAEAHDSQWAAIESIAAKMGCTAETLRRWVRHAECDQTVRTGLTSSERARRKAQERESRELRRANEILRKASAYFAQAELDRRPQRWARSSISTGRRTGSSRSARNCRSPRRRTTHGRRRLGIRRGARARVYDHHAARPDRDGLVHHSDRSTQYLSIRYTERLAEVGRAPSVGSVGDSYDKALAQSVIGLFKTEVIRRQGPWRHVEAVEFATLAWVDWFNTRGLFEPLGFVPPIEYEDAYYRRQQSPEPLETPAMGVGLN